MVTFKNLIFLKYNRLIHDTFKIIPLQAQHSSKATDRACKNVQSVYIQHTKKSLPGDKLPLLFLCAWKVNETVHFRIDMTAMHYYYLVGFALAAEFPLGNAHQLTRYYVCAWVKCTQMRSYVPTSVSNQFHALKRGHPLTKGFQTCSFLICYMFLNMYSRDIHIECSKQFK